MVLAQLVALTQSIKDLVTQNTEPVEPPPTEPVEPPPAGTTDAAQRTRVVFAYDFLGQVLGRRTPRVFQPRTVDVNRRGAHLTFSGLTGVNPLAKIRSNKNVVVELGNLVNGQAVHINQSTDPAKHITNDQRIDSIIVLDSPGGVPVAIGPCLTPNDDTVENYDA